MDELPFAVKTSRLYKQGGYDVVEGLPSPTMMQNLTMEARRQRAMAIRHEVDVNKVKETRGGCPARRFSSSQGGAYQDDFFGSAHTIATLSAWLGVNVKPCGVSGTYSYYDQPGDYLDLHRDIVTCDVALITALHDNSPNWDPHGALALYPTRLHEPISHIRATPQSGELLIKLGVGQSIILLGGIVPHCLLGVGTAQHRVVSVLCYELSVG